MISFKSLHIFLNDCKDSRSFKWENYGYELWHLGNLTSKDNVPFKYNHEIKDGFLNCSKPLYISNQMVILSPDIPQQKYPVDHILNTFDIKIWSLIIMSLIFIMFINRFSFKLKSVNIRLQNIWQLFWIHFWPMIGKPHNLGFRCYLYLLWIIALFPLTEIVKNDLLANLLNQELIPLETIDDILELYDKKIVTRIYTDSFKVTDYNHYIKTNTIEKSEFTDKLLKMSKLFIKINEDIMDLVPFLDDPEQMVKIISSSVLIEDEEWVDIVLPFLKRIVSGHRGEAYIPFLITPFCYGYNFQFVSEVESL